MTARQRKRRRFWLVILPLVLIGGGIASHWMQWWLVAFFASAALCFATGAYGTFLVGMATVGLAFCAWAVVQQGLLIEHARPIRGRLERVEFEKGRRRSLRVVPRYTYAYAGRTYHGRATEPMETFPDHGPSKSYRRDEARRVAERMARNHAPVVYVYERDPSRAYLRREYDWRPYTMLGAYIVFWSFVMLGGVSVASGRHWRGFRFPSSPAPTHGDDGTWHELLRATPPTSARAAMLVAVGLAIEALVAWLVWHYWTHVGRPVSWLTLVPTLLGLLPLLLGCALFARRRHAGEARVWVNNPTPFPGDPIRVRVRQRLSRRRDLESVRFGVACERTEWVGRGKSAEEKTSAFWADWEDRTEALRATSPNLGQVEGERTFKLPADAPASTPAGEYPRVWWTVKVRTKLRGLEAYERDFVIPVSGV